MESYTVLALTARPSIELEVKRSRFFSFARRTQSVEDAQKFLEEIRALYPDARNHCWAYTLGPDRRIQKSSDDGEPGGTAGVPILDTILKKPHLSDVMIVVVRYFGGVLLGAGGLVRAYSEAASKVLEESVSNLILRKQRFVYRILIPHAQAGQLENVLRASEASVLNVEYAHEVTIEVAVPNEKFFESLEHLSVWREVISAPELRQEIWVDITH